LVLALLVQTPALAQSVPAPLTGQAWSLADEAYKAYDARDFAAAVGKAREAVALRPDLAQLRRLLINSLAAQGDISGAVREADRAVSDHVTDAELLALQQSLKQQLAGTRPSGADAAYQAADAGYRAYARHDFAAAAARAREAIARDPSRANYHALLIDALSRGGRAAEAEKAADAALSRFPGDASLHLQRGYLRQKAGRASGAVADFTVAMNASSLTVAQRRNARLSLVDTLLTAHKPQQALATLGPLGKGYDTDIRRAYALQALQRHEEALSAFGAARRTARDQSQRSAALRGELGELVSLGHIDEARVRFNEAYAAGQLRGVSSLDLAYLAGRVGERGLAYKLFQQADAEGALPSRALLDAAYAARGQFDNAAAENYFRRAIDAHHRGDIALSPQRLFEVRRDVATLTRTWGATASLIYGPVGVMPGAPIGIPSSGATLQAGTEFYWRPPGIGFRDGATFEVFGRAFTTLHDKTGGPTGADTTQGSFGARWKPLTDINLVLEAGRLFRIGKYARNDWQLRVAYSTGEGGDLRRDTDNWRYWQIYAEANRFLETPQTLASAEARFGHSFRVDAVSPNLVFSPFVAVGAAYDSTLATRAAYGAGPGVNLRYWFREDRYTAPMSFIDLSVQYRARLAGDRRAEGWFGFLSVVY
jgi:tetratricopeptide (TPR) repeat protein